MHSKVLRVGSPLCALAHCITEQETLPNTYVVYLLLEGVLVRQARLLAQFCVVCLCNPPGEPQQEKQKQQEDS